MHDRAGLGRHRLHEHAPVAAASGAAGELRDEREGALLGAEVREAQRRVGVEHDGERDVGEVVALGHHLRADEHAGRARLEAGAGRRRRRLARGGDVGVEAQHREVAVAERLGQLVLEALGAGAVTCDRRRAAVAAARGRRLAVAAVVAGEQIARRGAARARRRTPGSSRRARRSGR